METQTPSRTLPYVVVALGAVLAFAAAVVPHYTAGYRLLFGVLLAGLAPYFVYALAVPLLRGGLLAVTGLVLLALHAALVIRERFLQGADYSDGLIHIAPLVLAAALLPVLWRALREPWGAEPPGNRPH
jgi:hypothetical protein